MAVSRIDGSWGRRPTMIRSTAKITIMATRVIAHTSGETCMMPPAGCGRQPLNPGGGNPGYRAPPVPDLPLSAGHDGRQLGRSGRTPRDRRGRSRRTCRATARPPDRPDAPVTVPLSQQNAIAGRVKTRWRRRGGGNGEYSPGPGWAVSRDETAAAVKRWSPLAADGTDLRDLRAAAGTRIRAPVRHQHHAWLDQLQAIEVAGELLQAPGPVRDGARCLVLPQGLLKRFARVDAVVDRQVAARGQAVNQPGHDRPRLGIVGDVTEDPHQRQPDRLGQIQPLRRLPQDHLGVTHVG